MIDSAALLADLKKQLKLLQADLLPQAEDASTKWGARLREQHREATKRQRTSQPWVEWRDNQVDQAAVAWILACVFIRFSEDNALLDGARGADGRAVPTLWFAGPDGRTARAVENQTEFVRGTAYNVRDWMLHAFGILADQPAGAALLDRQHNLVWTALISAEAAGELAAFWRATADGELVHNFTDASLDTRFLGDLYQDLSEHAKKTYALLQTPVFVEEFILDQTLKPAIEEFGLQGLRLIDPTCGSGHFLLGAFARLNVAWATQLPGMPAEERLKKVLQSLHGVDINPFAVAVAKYRLTVAVVSEGLGRSLTDMPDLHLKVATGDSLLSAGGGRQGELNVAGGLVADYDNEDLAEHPQILELTSYHVVVGNPPYITVKDAAVSGTYRLMYRSTYRQYALSAPFAELFFRLAIRGGEGFPAGFVGQITSNSFMKREFGKVLVEEVLSGRDSRISVDLQLVVDTSGAYIPGHGTPTVILIGRRRRVFGSTVKVVSGERGEPGQPAEPAQGLVWRELLQLVEGDEPATGLYASSALVPRERLAPHPWALAGGTAVTLRSFLEDSRSRLKDSVEAIGRTTVLGEDDGWLLSGVNARRWANRGVRVRAFVAGDVVRDYSARVENFVVSAYEDEANSIAMSADSATVAALWPLRSILSRRTVFGKSLKDRRMPWWVHLESYSDKLSASFLLTFPFVATHNHVVLDGGGRLFNRSAPVIKLPSSATEQDHLDLLGVLNSSTACFWLKQVSHDKGSQGINEGGKSEAWERFFEFTGTKLQQCPLPSVLPGECGRLMDDLATRLGAVAPTAVLAETSDQPVHERVGEARRLWHDLRARMVFEQEELDWEVYRLYGLVDEDLTYGGDGARSLALGERAFEVALARQVRAGTEETAWFERHGSTPTTELSAHWPDDYRALVQRRLDVIAEDPQIALLERPEHKRRWATPGWDKLLKSALEEAMLDRLEEPSLWRDDSEVQLRTVAQAATSLRRDSELRDLVTLYTGTSEHDLTTVLSALVADQAVPYLAAYRYKEPGVEKYREWQRVWALQREEDAGKAVDVPVPPKYAQADFRSTAVWRNRGKLDVPKERFIAHPGVGRPGDRSPLLGWAGWSQEDQAIALAREITDQEAEGAGATVLEPMVAGLVELEPWLHQWHTDGERGNAAESISGFLDQQLEELGKTRADVDRWRPEPARRGRRPRS